MGLEFMMCDWKRTNKNAKKKKMAGQEFLLERCKSYQYGALLPQRAHRSDVAGERIGEREDEKPDEGCKREEGSVPRRFNPKTSPLEHSNAAVHASAQASSL